jgi:hypothetical protein
MTFKKSFLFKSLILVAVLNIQSAFAMDGVDEESGWSLPKVLSSANNRLGQVRDLIDELKGISPPKTISPAKSVGGSEIRFFSELSDEVTLLYVFPLLCKDELALAELSAVALTCKQGYHLVQDSSLWKPLEKMLKKKSYFTHVLGDDLSRFIANKDLPPLALAHSFYQRFLPDLPQSEENFIIQLKYIEDTKARFWIYLNRECLRCIEEKCARARAKMAWA